MMKWRRETRGRRWPEVCDIDPYRANTNRKYKKWYTTKEFTDLVAGLKLSFPSIVVLFDPFDKSIVSLENRIRAKLIASETTLRKNFRTADQFTERDFMSAAVLNNLFSYDNTPRQMRRIWFRPPRWRSPRSAIPHTDDVISLLNDLFQLLHRTESLSPSLALFHNGKNNSSI